MPEQTLHRRTLDEIFDTARFLHSAGSFTQRALRRLVRNASARTILHSVETGSGASTLILSHLSADHTVFALDGGTRSVTAVRSSPLFNSATTKFVEGPTQLTLPDFRPPHKLQFALLDGPHAYPFPDIEYYWIYPHLDLGGLLVLDDIHIRTIHNLYEFLKRDKMFELIEVCDTTAFFQRTSEPLFDPLGDGWWLQEYNKRLLLRHSWKQRLKGMIPVSVKLALRKVQRRAPSDREEARNRGS